jgi:hypothetical protein
MTMLLGVVSDLERAFPRRLKPGFQWLLDGVAEATPFQNRWTIVNLWKNSPDAI